MARPSFRRQFVLPIFSLLLFGMAALPWGDFLIERSLATDHGAHYFVFDYPAFDLPFITLPAYPSDEWAAATECDSETASLAMWPDVAALTALDTLGGIRGGCPRAPPDGV